MALDGTHLAALDHLDQLFRPRQIRTDPRDGTNYEGFPTQRLDSFRPLFDLGWALSRRDRDYPPETLLRGLGQLVELFRPALRHALEEAMAAGDEYETAAKTDLRPNSTLLDDLLFAEYPPGAVCYGHYDEENNHLCEEAPGPLLPKLIESGILTRLLTAMSDPKVRGFGPALVDLLTHRDNLVELKDEKLSDPLLPGDESPENRSVFQRLLHLVHDTNGAPYGTSLTRSLVKWQVQNQAVFYLESYCDSDEPMMPGLVRFTLGEYFPDAHPTPYEIAKFMVTNHEKFSLSSELLLSNPVGREGRALYDYNADTLLALEISQSNPALTPIVRAFCDYGRPTDAGRRDHRGLLLLANFFSVLHEHYSTLPQYTTEMTASFDFYGVERPARHPWARTGVDSDRGPHRRRQCPLRRRCSGRQPGSRRTNPGRGDHRFCATSDLE